MTTKPAATSTNREKDPDDWVTGAEAMIGAQASYLKTLCEETDERFDAHLTKAEASRRIEELQAKKDVRSSKGARMVNAKIYVIALAEHDWVVKDATGRELGHYSTKTEAQTVGSIAGFSSHS
jgi:Protein of unknown function (DUF3072)